jgi:hypothetical protein
LFSGKEVNDFKKDDRLLYIQPDRFEANDDHQGSGWGCLLGNETEKGKKKRSGQNEKGGSGAGARRGVE